MRTIHSLITPIFLLAVTAIPAVAQDGAMMSRSQSIGVPTFQGRPYMANETTNQAGDNLGNHSASSTIEMNGHGIDLGNGPVYNVPDPVDPQDAVNLRYLQDQIGFQIQHRIAISEAYQVQPFAQPSARHALSIGNNARSEADGAVSIGDFSRSTHEHGVAIGRQSVAGWHAVAIGKQSSAAGSDAVALGSSSIADEAKTISVGNRGMQRKIVFVAPGSSATDAVNVSQLTARDTRISQLEARIRSLEAQMAAR